MLQQRIKCGTDHFRNEQERKRVYYVSNSICREKIQAIVHAQKNIAIRNWETRDSATLQKTRVAKPQTQTTFFFSYHNEKRPP